MMRSSLSATLRSPHFWRGFVDGVRVGFVEGLCVLFWAMLAVVAFITWIGAGLLVFHIAVVGSAALWRVFFA